jgi:lipoate-protein ligase A
MSRLAHLRLIIEAEPHSGAWNMAVDEALLETAISDNVATLRWYEWHEATVSLGYFQKSAEWLSDPVLSQLPAVRRLSGGGAIVHDDELTYSIALPSNQELFDKPPKLYEVVHQSLIDKLRTLDVPVAFRGETLKKVEEPLLCFQRQDAHDLVLGGFKILGSAQRRRRGAILQHGSLIRKSSQLTPHLPGFRDICPLKFPDDLARILAIHLSETIADSWSLGELSDHELDMTRRICEQGYHDVHSR